MGVRKLRITAMVPAIVVTALLVCHLAGALSGTNGEEKHPRFDESEFLVLLFPTPENELCRRAVIASLEECGRDAIEVCQDSRVITVARDLFTAAPPQGYAKLIEGLNEALARWGRETDWESVAWECGSDRRRTVATLQIEDKRGTLRQHTYRIDNATARPIATMIKLNPAKNLAN